MTAGAALNLRQLADIARDRSAAGRAKLFACLAILLTSRWSSLTPGERDQLGELVMLLLPRAAPADRQMLIADLAGRTDIPKALQHLASEPGKAATPAEVVAARLPMPPVVISAVGAPAHPPSSPLKSATGKLVRITVTQGSAASRPVMPHRATADGPGQSLAGPATPSGAAKPPTDSAAMVAPESPSGGGRESPPLRCHDDLISPVADRRINDRASGDAQILLTEARGNPHRLNSDLLAEALAAGDLARFEMMLAHLASLRAPLLRRLLKEGGNESFAILARAIGLDADDFQRQWQQWRQQMLSLEPFSRQPDRREGQRIGAFFAALTDRQVERLMERWRSDGARFFAGSDVPA